MKLKPVDYQCNKVTKICFRNKRRSILEAFLSVFIIHIHIDRFLIQHGFDSVTVFSAWFFFFFTRITIKNDKDNTMYDSLLNFMAMLLLNGFCISRSNRCCIIRMKPFTSTWFGFLSTGHWQSANHSHSYDTSPQGFQFQKCFITVRGTDASLTSDVTSYVEHTHLCTQHTQFHNNDNSSVSSPSSFSSQHG